MGEGSWDGEGLLRGSRWKRWEVGAEGQEPLSSPKKCSCEAPGREEAKVGDR